jgi:ABC-2 type transport system permease protein
MKPWLYQVRVQALGFLREPAAAVFNLVVPFLVLFLQGAAFGDAEVGRDLPGYRFVDLLPLTAAVMFVLTIGLFGMSIGLASMAESRTLAGCRLRKGGVFAVVSAYATVLLVLLAAGLTVATLAAGLTWQIRAPARLWALVPAVALCAVTLLALGTLVASLVRTPRAGQAVASALFFPMLFLSGALFSLDDFPAGLRALGHALPGWHSFELLSYAWLRAAPFPLTSTIYLLVVTATCTLVAVELFRRREDL